MASPVDDHDGLVEAVVEKEEEEEEVSTADETDKDVVKEDEKEEDEDERDADGWEDLLGSGRLKKRVLSPAPTAGDGDDGAQSKRRKPQSGDEALLALEVWFGETVVSPREEVRVCVGESEVVQAVDLALPVSDVGERGELMADPELAYGQIGLPDAGLPPNAAVRIVYHILEVNPPRAKSDMTLEERTSVGGRKKDKGNWWYRRDNPHQAIQCYRKAAEYFDDEQLDLDAPLDRLSLSSELQDLLDARVKTLNNLAMCQIKVEAWDSAMETLRHVLRIEPNNEKALYRKSKVLQEKLKSDEAIGVLRRLTRLYPNNANAQKDLARLTAKQKRQKENESRMSRKMLGLDKAEAESARRRSSSWATFAFKSSLAVGAVGAAVGAVVAAAKWRMWW